MGTVRIAIVHFTCICMLKRPGTSGASLWQSLQCYKRRDIYQNTDIVRGAIVHFTCICVLKLLGTVSPTFINLVFIDCFKSIILNHVIRLKPRPQVSGSCLDRDRKPVPTETGDELGITEWSVSQLYVVIIAVLRFFHGKPLHKHKLYEKPRWCCNQWWKLRIKGTDTVTRKIILVWITKTCLYNSYPLQPHFYIVKLGFTGVYIIFLISAQKHRVWVLVRTASPRRF